MWKKALALLPVALLLSGCAGTFTNLTSLQQPRNANNLYNVEVAFNSRQQSMRWDSIKPSVLVNGESYAMRPTLLMGDRWEASIPVPAGTNLISYRYKFDYQYNSFGPPKSDSAYSPAYKLHVVDQ